MNTGQDASWSVQKSWLMSPGSAASPLSSTQPPPHPPAVALSKQPQFIAIRYAQNSNLHNLIRFSSYFIQLLCNTAPARTTQHPPSILALTKPPPLTLLPVTYRLLHLTAAFAPGFGKLIERGTADKTPHVESGRMPGRLFHTGSRQDGCAYPPPHPPTSVVSSSFSSSL